MQVVLSSSMLSSEVLEMTKFMTDPISILIKHDEFFVAVEKEEWKFGTLCDLYDVLTVTRVVIFCNTRQKVSCSYPLQIRASSSTL